MGVKPIIATKTVTNAGTATQVSTSNLYVTSVYFEALGTNTGYIYVGLSDVTSTLYMTRLAAGEGFTIDTDSFGHTDKTELNLTNLYVNSSVNNEKVQVSYMQRMGEF